MNDIPMTRGVAGLAVAAFMTLTLPHALEAQRTETVFSGTLPAGTSLRVATATGSVDVEPASGNTLEVTGIAHERNGPVTFEVRREGNELIVCALREDTDRCTERGVDSRGSHNRDRDSRGDLRVRLPSGIDLAAASGNGPVEVRGAGGDVSAASGNGSVDVDGAAGEVHATSGNGAVNIRDVGGPVRAASGNGRVVVQAARGPVNASSGNGDIEVDIATLPDSGEMRFSSGNGSIELSLPDDFGAELDARLGNGEVDSAFPLTIDGRIDRHHIRATIGDGRLRLEVSSGNGDLILRRR